MMQEAQMIYYVRYFTGVLTLSHIRLTATDLFVPGRTFKNASQTASFQLSQTASPSLYHSQSRSTPIPANMASSSHPTFPSRPYASNLGKLPDRSLGATFGASTTQQQRENARLEREREKLERERQEREEQNQLTEEQREEIKEAVRLSPSGAMDPINQHKEHVRNEI